MEAIKLCRLDTPIIFIEARINLSRFVVTGCAAKTSATVTFPSLNLISLFAFCFNIWLNGVASSLHFHAVHFMRTLPTGSVDPNFGRRVRNRRQLNSLQNTWPYGYSMPIAVRYTQDAFSRSGWLWPVDAKGEPLKATSYMAVGFYVAKYVNKKSDMDLA